MRKRLMTVGAVSAALLATAVTLPAGAGAAPPQVPDIASPALGPFPALSGYGRTLRGDIALGWHGPPPPDAVTKGWTLRSASHKLQRRPAARAKPRSAWG